jgi:hypothetical protein
MRINFNEEELLDAFVFLDGLRESGETNMMGARVYLDDEFPDWGKPKTSKVLSLWMKTYDPHGATRGGIQSMDDRVMAALELVAHEDA